MQQGSPAASAGLSARCPELPQVLPTSIWALVWLSEERGRYVHEVLVDRLQFPDGIVQGHSHDRVTPQGHHLPEGALLNRVDCGDSESRREHAIEGGRRAAPLDMSEDCGTRLEAGALFDLTLARNPDT